MPNIITPTPTVNKVISAANDLPSLIEGLQQIDPALAQQLTGKAAGFSKSIFFPIASGVVVLLVTKYNLHWDEQTTNLVADILSGATIFAVGVICRFYTTSPITSWFRKKV